MPRSRDLGNPISAKNSHRRGTMRDYFGYIGNKFCSILPGRWNIIERVKRAFANEARRTAASIFILEYRKCRWIIARVKNFDRTRFQTDEMLREFANCRSFSFTPTYTSQLRRREIFFSQFLDVLLRSAHLSLRYRPPRAKRGQYFKGVPSRRIRNHAENTVGDNEETAKRRVFRRPGNSLLFG